MIMENALISIIIPFYNSRSTIERAVQSVLRQTYPHIEVWVVDDGSDDGGLSLMKQLQDERIHCQRLPHHNANVTRNYGIMHSHGEYIAMLDADDEWTENHLESSLAILQREGADGVYGSLILRGTKDREVTTRAIRQDESTIDFLLSNECGAQTSTLVMTAASAKDILWDETLNRHQDYDFIVRYCRKYRLSPKLEATTIYHLSDSSKKIDFDSCIRFIHTVENEISDWVYTNYHRNMLQLAIACAVDKVIIQHYRKEATYYAYLLSLYDYLALKQPHSNFEICKMKVEYLCKLIGTRILL